MRFFASLPTTGCFFHSEVSLHNITKLIMKGDSSLHFVTLGMTDHLCYRERGDVCGSAANVPSLSFTGHHCHSE